MNKIRKYIPKIVILDTAIYIWIFVMLHLILQCFGLKFREWVYWMSVLLMMMGFITGIIQLILKFKKRIVNMYNGYICYSSINIKSHILFDSRVWIYTGTCC